MPKLPRGIKNPSDPTNELPIEDEIVEENTPTDVTQDVAPATPAYSTINTEVSESPRVTPAVTIIAPDLTTPEKVTAQSNVKVRCRYDHSCTVAGVKYSFKKGVVQTVPLNVKKVLERADLLLPLN